MMWNRAELKMRGNMAFKKNYVSAVVVALLMGIFGTVSGESSARRVSENSDIYSGNLFNVGMITGLLAGIATVVILIVLVAKVFVGNLLKMGGYRFFILNRLHSRESEHCLTVSVPDIMLILFLPCF